MGNSLDKKLKVSLKKTPFKNSHKTGPKLTKTYSVHCSALQRLLSLLAQAAWAN